MATVRHEIVIDRPPHDLWDALRDVGALHTRLAPGFVVDCRLEPGARIVTFANGQVVRELLISVDDAAQRVAWSVVGTRMTHHSASAQVFEEGAGSSRFVWIADFLPDDVAPTMSSMIAMGLATMKRTLEGTGM